MNGELEAAAADMCCASCGKAEVDDVKLKKCACNLLKYCSVECQRNHRPQHKKTCKQRRLKYVKIGCSVSPMATIMESVRFAACRCQLV